MLSGVRMGIAGGEWERCNFSYAAEMREYSMTLEQCRVLRRGRGGGGAFADWLARASGQAC